MIGKVKNGISWIFNVCIKAIAIISVAILVMSGADKILLDGSGNEETVKARTTQHEINVDYVNRKLHDIAELATFEQEYEGVKEDSSTREIWGVSVPGTKNSVSINYTGNIKVGYDFDEIEVSVNDWKHRITVTLPPVQVLSNEIDEDTLDCVDQNNIFNPITSDQILSYFAEIEAEELKAAENDGIYIKAEEHAKLLIKDIFSDLDDYELVII